MITTKCPSCSSEVRAPESFLGKKIRCKATHCGQVFLVSEISATPIAAAPSIPPVVFATIPPPSDGDSDGDVIFKGSPRSQSSYHVTPNLDVRYPNLRKYLAGAKTLALIQFVLSAIFGFSTFALSIMSAIFADAPVRVALITILVGGILGVVAVLIGYILFVAAMAVVEFVYVVLDIEANTRSVLTSNTGD